MESFMVEYNRKIEAKVHPVIITAYLHDKLVKIHPFIDGNGRISRLLMNLYCYVIVNLKGDNESKINYYTALEKSHTENNPTGFYTLVANSEKDALTRYINMVRG